MTVAFHTMNTCEWYTPSHIIESVRKVLGEITLDPCSNKKANETVKAQTYLCQAQNGLTLRWVGTGVYVNPPGGKISGKSLPGLFWKHLISNMEGIGNAIFMAYSIQQLQTLQNCLTDSPLLYPICIPRKRINFDSSDKKFHAPPHPQAIIYVPGYIDNTQQFKKVFSELGSVKL